MSTFLYITGLIVGICFFLYLLSAYEAGKKRLKNEIPVKEKNPVKPTLEPEDVTYKNFHPPGERLCPVCMSPLSKYEALYASHVETKSGNKILIYGCKYCYKPDEDSDKRKKSEY